MAATELSHRLVNPSEVDFEFARNLQGIAQRAWTAGLDGTRSPEEIAEAFNPDNPTLVAEAQKQYADFAKQGLGYKWDGITVKEKYRFGEHNEPTTQRRYVARVDAVIAHASERLGKIS